MIRGIQTRVFPLDGVVGQGKTRVQKACSIFIDFKGGWDG